MGGLGIIIAACWEYCFSDENECYMKLEMGMCHVQAFILVYVFGLNLKNEEEIKKKYENSNN